MTGCTDNETYFDMRVIIRNKTCITMTWPGPSYTNVYVHPTKFSATPITAKFLCYPYCNSILKTSCISRKHIILFFWGGGGVLKYDVQWIMRRNELWVRTDSVRDDYGSLQRYRTDIRLKERLENQRNARPQHIQTIQNTDNYHM